VYRVTLRFYEELNDFLPPPRRKRSFEVVYPEARSVKDLIESLGVPHTEIDLIVANGDSVGFNYRVRDRDRIAVYPVFEAFDVSTVSRLGRPPLREPRFLADVHLGKLARLLRLLGLDCAYDRRADDAGLLSRSLGEGRILLTRDRRLLMRRELSHGICIRSADPEEQCRQVVRRVQLEQRIAPFTRCLACNGPVEAVPKEAVIDRIPERTKRFVRDFRRCGSCGRTYWKGAHYASLKETVKRLSAPAAPGVPPRNGAS